MDCETDPDGTPVKQLLPSTGREWRIFERNFGLWLRDNAETITLEEGRPFKRATYDCFALGLCSGMATSLTLSKTRFIKRAGVRRLFSTFTGLYAIALCMNYQRKPIYTALLNSPGRVGDAARQILLTARRATANSSYSESHPSEQKLTEVTVAMEPLNDDTLPANDASGCRDESGYRPIGVPKSNKQSKGVRITPINTATYKTWEDIRRENQHGQSDINRPTN